MYPWTSYLDGDDDPEPGPCGCGSVLHEDEVCRCDQIAAFEAGLGDGLDDGLDAQRSDGEALRSAA